MRVSIIAILSLAAVGFGPWAECSAVAATKVIPRGLVSLIEEAQVPAQEPGELMEVVAHDGQQVSSGEVLARIDDKLAKLELDVRKTELDVAQKRSKDTVSIDYAKAAAKVLEADYWRKVKSNEQVPGSVPKAEEERALLEYEQYRQQIIKAEFELEIAVLEVKVSEAQVAAANEHIVRREIKAPWDGIVDEVHRHTGDWVNSGDPILRLVRMDHLKIKASIGVDEYTPDEVMGRPVTVKVLLARGATETFKGKIAGISPIVDGNNEFSVWAAIENKKRNGYWILRDGMYAEMTIHFD
ncbi:MAG: HlyD family efflux transporter periplasmic adaptor subunit [Pirellulales bacterium]|nr:HlyD family efflux transporter periplasmic adaptor subunit [Pirellulales bacterium]